MNNEHNLSELLEMIGSLGRLDFEKRLEVTDENDPFGQLSIGLNMLGEELEATVVDKNSLIESEEKFRTIADNVPELFCFINTNLEYEFVNEKYKIQIGKPLQELIGKKIENVIDSTFKISYPYMQRALNGEKVRFEVEPVVNGEKKVQLVNYVPSYDKNKIITGFYALIQDLTDYRKEHELSKMYFNIIDRSMNEIFIFNSTDFKFSYMNKGALQNLGYSMAELKERTPLDLKKSMKKQEFLKIIDPLVTGKKNLVQFESKHYRKDGTTYTVEVNLGFDDKDKKNRKFVAIIKDISEKKAAEAKTRQNLINYLKLFNAANIGIFIVNCADKNIIQVNQYGAEQIGYNVKELVGLNMFDLFPKVQQGALDTNLFELDKNKEVLFESKQVKKNGEEIEVEISAKITILDGKKVHQAFIKDITRRKTNEKLIREKDIIFKNLYNDNISGLYRADMEYNIIECNNSFAQILGFNNKEEVLNTSIKNIFVDNKLSKTNTRKFGDLECYETQIRLKNGDTKWVLENVKLNFDEQRTPKYIDGTMFDISDRIDSLEKLKEEKLQSTEYELQLLSSQLNPHFIFNTLNSFQYYILNEKPEDSLDYISNFSKLMRLVLENSTKKFIYCSDEIKFLKSYLEISKSRKKGKFDYQIEVCDSIDI